MAAKENTVYKKRLLTLSRIPGLKLFRNNVGKAYAGKGFTMSRGQTYTAKGGERLIMEPRIINFGLCTGSGDGIGWRSKLISADMVGSRVAVFLSLETKAGKGKASEEQLNWGQVVERAGGIVIITNNEVDAVEQLINGR